MADTFLQTIPFFLVIGLGYGAARTGFFTPEATAWLTKFVFYFALSAMLFRFSANLSVSEVFEANLAMAYLSATAFVYGLAMAVALLRRVPAAKAAFEAQCAAIGNTGFLGVPMLALLMGEASAGPVILALAIDLIVFGSLVVILVAGSSGAEASPLRSAAMGLARNPMIISIALGFAWSAAEAPIPAVMNDFLALLGGAATPGALFAIGASLAGRSVEQPLVAAWLSLCKLGLHPLAVAVAALLVFDVDPYPAAVMIATASLPVAGNIYILAQHYKVAPHRVSASILVSTALAVVSVSLITGWASTLY